MRNYNKILIKNQIEYSNLIYNEIFYYFIIIFTSNFLHNPTTRPFAASGCSPKAPGKRSSDSIINFIILTINLIDVWKMRLFKLINNVIKNKKIWKINLKIWNKIWNKILLNKHKLNNKKILIYKIKLLKKKIN